MKSLLSLFIALVLFIQNVYAASDKFTTSSPVMKIRFNSAEVSYHNKLQNMLDKIFVINKNAKFLIVSVIKSSAKAEDKIFSKNKIQELSKILSAYGISEKNIEHRILTDKNILNSEIHLYLAAN